MKMTNKQKAFISEYLVDLCATKAAIRAGYSAKRADAIGHENLRKPEIKAAIQSVTTGKAGGLTDCEPLKAVYSTDSLTTFRWSTT